MRYIILNRPIYFSLQSEPKKPRKKRVESMNMPYYELVMTGGTLCDLSGLPRKTRVLYVCYPSG